MWRTSQLNGMDVHFGPDQSISLFSSSLCSPPLLKSTLNQHPVFYSPDLESDLLPSELHSLDFEINSYKANKSKYKLPSFLTLVGESVEI